MHCDICNVDVDSRGYARHCKGSKHLKLKAQQEKKEKQVRKEEKQEETKQENQVQEEEKEDNALPELTDEEIEEKVISDPEYPKEKKEKDYLELRIIDGHLKEEKVKSQLDGILEKLLTPENIAIAGQVIGQILASKIQTQQVAPSMWGNDDKGNPVDF